MRGKLREDDKVKCQTCVNQQTDIAEGFPGIELTGQSLEIEEKFCYLGDTVGVRGGAYDSVKTGIRNG